MSRAFNGGYRQDFGDVVRKQRIELNISQRKFAEAIRVNPTTLNNYESGKRLPSKEVLERICSLLGVDTDFFARIPKTKSK